ncbi:MAG: 6-bladed beta-propeller [Salinivirgaceae bacterium]|nr:6-bladed beta-propeller [Salinivirgaceae bacterium]
MNHKLLTITAICATMMACNSKTEINVTDRIELPGMVDNEAFAANVESISVMNLQMDDAWTIVDNPNLAFAENYIYISDQRQIWLACFDRQTGEKISSRTIKGRGPGEITFLNTTFCIDDTLCVCTAKGIKQFDRDFKYLGDLGEFDDKMYGYVPNRLSNGNYAMVYSPFSIAMDTVPVIFLTDKSFNIQSTHFTIQPSTTPVAGGSPTYYAKGDTLRCFMPLDNHLYSLVGNSQQITELAVPNPLTSEALIGAEDPFGKAFEYDGIFGGLCVSGRFIVFGYQCNHDDYISMVDKTTNNAVSIIYNEDEEQPTSTIGVMVDFFNSIAILQTNDNYIYARCRIRSMNRLLEGHDDLLDARLKQTQAEYHACLERNAEYIKGLEPEERDAANVILKIKLKD